MTWQADRNRPIRQWMGKAWLAGSDDIAEEVPVALVYNGVSHVVMMATAQDLENFALGFSLNEGIIDSIDDVYAIEIEEKERGVLLNIEVSTQCFAKLKERRRNLTGRTGCGLCGAESLEQAVRSPSALCNDVLIEMQAIEKAFNQMTALQPLHLKTGATHAAAWADLSGKISTVREDVGRHNALDKLAGALCKAQFNPTHGFVLLSSRISYEMVQKSVAMGVGCIVAVSAPTGLAIDLAETTNVTLVRYSKQRGANIYTHSARIRA